MPSGNHNSGTMMKKLWITLYKVPLCILLLFSLFIWRLTLKSRFGNTILFQQFKSEPIQIITMLIGLFFLGVIIVYLCKIIENLTSKQITFTVVLLFFLLVAMQIIWYYFISRPLPTTDTATLVEQALAMVKEQNGQLNTQLPYFQHYSNNYCFILLLYYFYSFLSFLHITDVWLPTIVLNVAFIDLGIFLTYKIAKKISNTRKATIVLLLCLLCPTTYVWEGFTYTNTCSIPFIMGLLYLFLCLQNAILNWRTYIQLTLFGILLVFGVLIRSTTLLPIIAMFLTSCLKHLRNFNKLKALQYAKQVLLKAIILLVTIFVSFFLWTCIKSAHIPPVDKDNTFPVTHWIMMGTKDFGKYNREDLLYTSSLPTYEDKINGNLSVIKERLSSLTPHGYYNLCYKKLYSVWGDGSDECIVKSKSAFYYPPLYNYVYGTKNLFFAFYIQLFRCCTFFFLIFEIIRHINKSIFHDNYVLLLTMLGCILFFLLWEANSKYNICFNYISILLMVDGIFAFRDQLLELPSLLFKRSNRGKRLLHTVKFASCILSILFVSTVLFTCYTSLTQTKDTFHSLVNYTGKKHVSVMNELKNKEDIIEQTFTSNQPFNEIRLYLKECSRETPNKSQVDSIDAKPYRIRLLMAKNNQVLYDKAIRLSDISKEKERYTIALQNTIYNKKPTEYKLQIQCDENTTNTLGVYYKNITHLTSYSYGKLTINHSESPYNLFIQILEKEKRTYTNEFSYILTSIGIILFLVLVTKRIYTK